MRLVRSVSHICSPDRRVLRPGTCRISATVLLFLTLSIFAEAWAQNVTTLTPEPFNASGGISVDAQGNIYVSNRGTAFHDNLGLEVYKVTSEGNVSLFADGFLFATGNTFDSQGNLYQASFDANRIDRITPEGVVTEFAGASEGVNNPTGLAFDAQGNLFVANCNIHTISRITSSGASSDFVAGNDLLNCPRGLAFDDEGNLYVTNFRNSLIIKVTPQGAASEFADTMEWSGAIGQNGFIIFAHGRFYLTSQPANRVLELSLEGELVPLAGNGELGRVDGPLLEASLQQPAGIGISPDGRLLYVNTSEDLIPLTPNVIRVIELPDIDEEFPINAGLNGNWWNGLARSGEGAQIDVADGGSGTLILVATVYSYDTMGNQIFLIAVGTANGDTAEVDVFITEGGMWGDNFDPALVIESQWGTGTFTASSCGAMHMSLKPNAGYMALGYTDLEYNLIRLTTPAIACPLESPN